MTTAKPDSIWTPAFALLCTAQFLGYAQHFILTPTFPLYVTQLGGSPFVVGLVLASFAVTSVIFRPLIGQWVDRWNEAGVMVSGMLLQGASTFLCYLPFVEASMLANGLRGIGWAGFNTGGYALLAVSAPSERRGEASGYYSGVQSSATILFPAVALWLIDAPFGGFGVTFFVASALPLIGAAIGALLTRAARRPAHDTHSNESKSTQAAGEAFWDRAVLLPSALLFCVQLTIPAATSFLVLYAKEIGVSNVEWYFVVSGITSMVARPLLGRFSDKIGRGRSLAAGFACQVVAMLLLVWASGLTGLIVSGVLYMLGAGVGGATTLALAMERASPERRGRAMAMFSVAFPLSAGVGALLTGSAVELTGYFGTFLLAAGFAAAGLALTLAKLSSLR
jgi:MFS family permease